MFADSTWTHISESSLNMVELLWNSYSTFFCFFFKQNTEVKLNFNFVFKWLIIASYPKNKTFIIFNLVIFKFAS